MIPLTEAAQGELHFVISTILRRKAGTQPKQLTAVVFMVLKKVGILINKGGLLYPRTTVQDPDVIQDIQGIDVRVLDHHFPLQDRIVLLPPYPNRRDLRETLNLIEIHAHRA